jgi:hypothetical protein
MNWGRQIANIAQMHRFLLIWAFFFNEIAQLDPKYLIKVDKQFWKDLAPKFKSSSSSWKTETLDQILGGKIN